MKLAVKQGKNDEGREREGIFDYSSRYTLPWWHVLILIFMGGHQNFRV